MKPFPWRPGMRAINAQGRPWRLYVGADGLLCAQGEPEGYVARWVGSPESVGARPDPADGATKGALLDAVREAWGDPHISVVPVERYNANSDRWEMVGWSVRGCVRDRLAQGASEFDALLAAWEAAP